MTKRRSWTSVETNVLIAMYQAHYPIRDIAVRLNRSVASVEKKLHTLAPALELEVPESAPAPSLPKPKAGWTDEKLERLDTMLNQGLSYEEIATELQVSVRSVAVKARGSIERPQRGWVCPPEIKNALRIMVGGLYRPEFRGEK